MGVHSAGTSALQPRTPYNVCKKVSNFAQIPSKK